MSLVTLKKNKIAAAVAIALLAIGTESNAATTNNTSPATSNVGYDTTNTNPIGSGITTATVSGGPFNTTTGITSTANGVGTGVTLYNGVAGSAPYNVTAAPYITITSAATGTTTNSSDTVTNTSTIIVTGGSGVGIVLRSIDTESHTAYASIYATDVAGTTAAAYASSLATSITHVDSNNVNNSGSITANTGIGLISTSSATTSATARAYVWANNDGVSGTEYPSASATSSAISTATSTILSNTIVNTGTINATAYGVQLKSTSTGADSASSAVDGYYGLDGYLGDDLTHSWASGAHTTSATNYSTVSSSVNLNNFTNSGDIIVSNGAGVVLNSVAVSTDHASSTAVSQVNTNVIANSGTIAASASSASNSSDGIGLYASTSGADRAGFTAAVNSNTISNTGFVYAMNNGINLTATTSYVTGALGAAATVNSNTITNTYIGRVVAQNIGINLNASTVKSNTINNTGLIVSDPGMTLSGSTITKSNPASWDANAATAINITSTVAVTGSDSNALNIGAPAYLAGRILLDSDSNTKVTLTSGISQSNRWAFQHTLGIEQVNQASPYAWVGGSATYASLLGTVPWFVNQLKSDVNGVVNDVYATIDPSAFAAAPNQLADLSNMVSTISRDGLAKNTTATDGFWLSAQGGVMNYDGNYSSTMKQDNNLYTVALGYNRTVLDDYRVGLVVGYSDASFDTGSFYKDLYGHSYNNKAKGGYLGARAATKVGPFDVDAGLSAGFQNHDDKRFVNDNLVWWGESTATSSYNSYWFSPEAGLSLPIPVIAGFTVSPNVRVSYSGQHIESYTESGTNANATIDSRYIGVVESKVGINIANSFGPVDVSADIGYMGRSLVGDDKVKVTMIGDVHDVSFYYRDVNAGYLKAKVNLNINDNVEAGVTASYTNGTNVEGGNVMGAVKVKF